MAIYYKYKYSEGTHKRPIAFVRVKNGDTVVDVFGLVDSGADVCFFPEDLAQLLNLKKENEEKVMGMGGVVSVFQSHATFQFNDKSAHRKHELKVPVYIGPLNIKGFSIIIGRAGIFNSFDITFKESEDKIVFKKVDEKKITW